MQMQRDDLQMRAAKNRIGEQKTNYGERKGDFGKSTITECQVEGCKSHSMRYSLGVEEYNFGFGFKNQQQKRVR